MPATRSPRPALAATAVLVASAALTTGVPGGTATAAEQPGGRAPVVVSLAGPTEVSPGELALFGVTVRDRQTGTPLPDVRVILQYRADGIRGWALADRTLTDATGRATLAAAARPPATEFRARAKASPGHAGGRSDHLVVLVR